MSAYNHKQITDPVHTTIGISRLEADVLNTSAFQRLRSVRQLGLAHLVFPGADYSRFAHSLGVCHVTGMILNSLKANSEAPFSEETIAKYRLAGLLHDIGHYPFSHAMEDAVADYYSQEFFADTAPASGVAEASKSSSSDARWFNHERLGKAILELDPELSSLLKQSGHEPTDVAAIFLREDPNRLKNLISSDLDADRIDYLMRTACHSGLPYGGIDLPYLLTQLRLDSTGEVVCLTQKAVRAADHFLLSRYFDYAQVAYHKTVAALELILKDVLKDLLVSGAISCSRADIEEKIKNGEWASFTDSSVIAHIEAVARSAGDAPSQIRARAIISRKPPKLIWEREELWESGKGGDQKNLYKKLIKAKMQEWSDKFGTPLEFWKEWSVGTQLTKIGSRVPPSLLASARDKDLDKYEQAIRIKLPNNTTTDLMSDRRSLMSVLSQHELVKVRVYLLVPPNLTPRLDEIRRQVAADLDTD